ncbi:MAG: hypothetical protein ACR65R_16015 [Methylomicrobium sp.]
MANIKLFITVLLAVFFGNIATLAVVNNFGIPTIQLSYHTLTTAINKTQASLASQDKNNGVITLRNLASNSLSCSIQKDGNYGNLFIINDSGEQTLNDFVLGSNVRCSIQIDPRSSTMLTYFQPIISGVYQFKLEKVPCKSCKNQNWRWATVYYDPNGKSDYTDWP